MQRFGTLLMSAVLLLLVAHSSDSHCFERAEREHSISVSEDAEPAHSTQSEDLHFCHAGHCAFVVNEKVAVNSHPISLDFVPSFSNFSPEEGPSELLRPPRV